MIQSAMSQLRFAHQKGRIIFFSEEQAEPSKSMINGQILRVRFLAKYKKLSLNF